MTKFKIGAIVLSFSLATAACTSKFQIQQTGQKSDSSTDANGANTTTSVGTTSGQVTTPPASTPNMPIPPVVSAPTAPVANTSLYLAGVNISGGEYNGGKVGAKLFFDYVYPSKDEIVYFAAKGLKSIRMTFDANRIQPTRLGPLSTVETGYIDSVVANAAASGIKVILDPHNYGYLNDNAGTGRLIGVDPLMPSSYFADFWAKLATKYKDNPTVIFGLMNEPFAHTAAQWKGAAVAAIDAIRATGAKNKILVPGTSWTGAHSWIGSGNAAAWAGFTDMNFAFEVHQYLDSDSSGTHTECVAGTGGSSLKAFTDWARANKVQGYLGEIGWADNAACMTEGAAIMKYMKDNVDVFIGYGYWSAGAWLGGYMYSIEPTGLGSNTVVDKPQMAILAK